jgi:hypothetical protein
LSNRWGCLPAHTTNGNNREQVQNFHDCDLSSWVGSSDGLLKPIECLNRQMGQGKNDRDQTSIPQTAYETHRQQNWRNRGNRIVKEGNT